MSDKSQGQNNQGKKTFYERYKHDNIKQYVYW